MLPEASSCRSASLRLMFLKNHLGTRGRAQWILLGFFFGSDPCCSLPTHGSGSRLFTKATKLCGISPSWPVVSDCAFHHSPFLQ